MRDLVWVMAAPNLLADVDWIVSDSECAVLLTRAMPQLLALDQQPERLHDWLAARKPQRLGPYFERLVAYWLTYLIDIAWFASNQIVSEGRTTIGEYDMLWRASSGLLNHWEVSAKLYLQADPQAGLGGYIGTMTRDRLDLKVERLRDKQLHLAQTAAGSAALPCPGEPVLARALFKGWLFYPANLTISPATAVSTLHLSGWWMRWGSREFNLPPNLRWCVLDRLAWLSPLLRKNTDKLWAEADFIVMLAGYFASHGVPLLIAGLMPTVNGWEEVSRGFVLSREWP